MLHNITYIHYIYYTYLYTLSYLLPVFKDHISSTFFYTDCFKRLFKWNKQTNQLIKKAKT